jgi:hypothetical protein
MHIGETLHDLVDLFDVFFRRLGDDPLLLFVDALNRLFRLGIGIDTLFGKVLVLKFKVLVV